MVRAMMLGVAVIVTLYLLINLAYLYVLGLQGLRKSSVVGADLMRVVAGDKGAIILSFIVCITATSTLNGTIFTGARSYYALGRDVASSIAWASGRSEAKPRPMDCCCSVRLRFS